MTAAEFRTLRDALGLSVEACCRIFAVADRTIRRWDAGRLPVPPQVAAELRAIDADYDAAAGAAARRCAELIAHHGGAPPEGGAILLRYRTDDDLARYRPDLRHLGTQAHGAMIDRAARALRAECGIEPRIEWLDPYAYEAWRGRRPDSEGLRSAWAGQKCGTPPGIPSADSPPGTPSAD